VAAPSAETLQRIASETGHQAGTLEKVLRLLDLLEEIARDPLLTDRFALKGGTALNVFHLSLDRLSVDIDLNYIGELDRAAMEAERPTLDAALQRLFASMGYAVRRQPEEHADGKWLARYSSALGGKAVLEVDVNYMARQPLFGTMRMDSVSLGGIQARQILLLNLHEIIAGKLVALLDRRAARDLFDARRILAIDGLDWRGVKAAVLAIGACGRRDWRTTTIDAIGGDRRELRQKLSICLPRNQMLQDRLVDTWITETVALCREKLAFLLDYSADEIAFLDGVLDQGIVQTERLDADTGLRTRIAAMPMLGWKCRHVRQHRGTGQLPAV
jgi:predicted nucleotidyltransferase component of viral defense system